jgi:hypothetical protein
MAASGRRVDSIRHSILSSAFRDLLMAHEPVSHVLCDGRIERELFRVSDEARAGNPLCCAVFAIWPF